MRAILATSLATALVFAMGASAQYHPMGFVDGWSNGSSAISFVHNPQSNFFPEGDILNRIDTDDYFGWGRDPTADPTYGTWCMVGVQYLSVDVNPSTAEAATYIQGWTEDPDRPNFPDVPGFDPGTGGSNFVTVGPIPPNPFPVTEWALTFTNPVCVATDGDLFLGLHIGEVGTGEGVLVAAVGDSFVPVPNLTIWDDPGPAAAAIAEDSYVCVVPTETPAGQLPVPTGEAAAYTLYRSQNHFEVYLSNASGGVCTAVTNQLSFDVSSPANGDGTTNFLSGVHPDASSAPFNPGRNLPPPVGWTGDRIGFVYSDHRLSAGDPVCVGVALQLAAVPSPLSSIFGTGPAPTGQLLFEIADMVPLAFGLAEPVVDSGLGLDYSRFAFTMDLPPFSRDVLQSMHPSIVWQGFGLDTSTGNVHATGVARQQF